MKIHDQSIARDVALRLQAFLSNAADICNKTYRQELRKVSVFTPTTDAYGFSLVLDWEKLDANAKELPARARALRELSDFVGFYADGFSMGSIVKSIAQTLAPPGSETDLPTHVIALNDRAKRAAQKTACEDMRRIVTVYAQANAGSVHPSVMAPIQKAFSQAVLVLDDDTRSHPDEKMVAGLDYDLIPQ